MPYYREYFDNSSSESIHFDQNGGVTNFPLVKDDAVLLGFRAKPHRNAYHASLRSDQSVDPYAYFLSQETKNQYQARLAERGMQPQGEPDRGHAFELSKYTLSGSWADTTYISKSSGSGEITVRYHNPTFVPTVPGDTLLKVRNNVWNPGADLATFAQRAYSRVAPTAKVFDAGQFLGELREGLPKLIPSILTSGSKFYRSIGSDYLNVEFGWKPFLNDLQNLGKALAGATTLLTGGGQRVSRRYGIPTWRGTDEYRFQTNLSTRMGYPGFRETTFGLPTGPETFAVAPAGGSAYVLRSYERTQWFEGEFTNFFKLGFDSSNYFDKLNELMSVDITPSVLWELAPWSWLVDWHLRIGDTIKANELAANDKLIMHYGYAMEHTLMRDLVSVDLSGVQRSNPGTWTYTYWPDLPDSMNWLATTEYKRRIRANPYGFRTGGTSALTEGQMNILGALGLSKLK